MALVITAKITCDMCGREETRPLRESMRHGKLSSDAPSLVREFPHWELLGRDACPLPTTAWRMGASCARAARGATARRWSASAGRSTRCSRNCEILRHNYEGRPTGRLFP